MRQKPKRPAADGGKIVLPPSGLAEDVLPQAGAVGAAGPQNLYTFADSLQPDADGAPRKEEESPETWVTFALERESFGLPVTHVQEILRVVDITRIPHAPPGVRGVTNMRGKVLPVLDLRVRLGLDAAPLTASSRILVTGSKGRLIGLLVDGVQQVLPLDRNRFQPPPPDVMTTQSDYILAVCQKEEALVILLEVERLFAFGVSPHPEPPPVGGHP